MFPQVIYLFSALVLIFWVSPVHLLTIQNIRPPVVLDFGSNLPIRLLQSRLSIESIQDVARALPVWRSALKKGLTPEEQDIWPRQPLFEDLVQTLWRLELPQLVAKHKELLEPVMSAVLDIGLNYTRRIQEKSAALEEEKQEMYQRRREAYFDDVVDEHIEAEYHLTEAMQADVIASLLRGFESKWGPPLQGISCLDSVLGLQGMVSTDDAANSGGGGGGAGGFGLFDGIWQHSGWNQMKELQKKLEGMPELRAMIHSLGRRPSARGSFKMRYPPMIADASGAMGVAKSPQLPVDMEGVQLSGDVHHLLFRDLMLLKGSPKLRRLFLAKYADRSLLTYQFSDWKDESSVPRRSIRRYSPRLPTTVGGPVIICIDTSWSMAGPRESLAKAVVLECAAMASRLKRDCYVLAFSGRGNLAECDLKLTTDKEGILRLLEFLDFSFLGGTDVISPLRRAMELMDEDDTWACADVVLVTDGELSMPPLDSDTSVMLEDKKSTRDLRVHGLLIGRNESSPLSMLCENAAGEDRVHTFLNTYDEMTRLLASRDTTQNLREPSSTRLYSHRPTRQSRPRSMRLHASARDDTFASRTESAVETLKARTPPIYPTRGSESERGQREKRRTIVSSVLHVLNSGLVERDAEVRLLLLAALSQEHILLVGPPGTGKSELGRRLSMLSSGRFFERLLTRYTQPEELFGPFSLKALEEDQYIRNVDGFLPTASTAFVDEIFKANSAILNTLLTILNERKFDNGNRRETVPLVTMIGASNELPDSDEVDALYDRFIFRKLVSSISDEGMTALLSQGGDTESLYDDAVIDTTEFNAFAAEVWEDSGKVVLSEQVISFMVALRAHLREVTPPIYCSDRRLKKASRVLAIAAAAMGNTHVLLSDVVLLQYILWSEPGDEGVLKEWIFKNIVPNGEFISMTFLLESAFARMKELLRQDLASEVRRELETLENVLLPLVASKQLLFESLADELQGDRENTNIWIDPSDLAAMRQQLAPRASRSAQEFGGLLRRGIEVQVLVSDYLEGVLLAEEACGTLIGLKEAASGSSMDGTDEDGESEFSGADLALSKKEAQRKFTGDQLKRWKKQVKSLSKQGGSRGGADDDDE